MSCENHKKDVAGITNMTVLAEAIGNLHYETLAELLCNLSDKIFMDAAKDSASGRFKLASKLEYMANTIHLAAKDAESVWVICRPFMEPKN